MIPCNHPTPALEDLRLAPMFCQCGAPILTTWRIHPGGIWEVHVRMPPSFEPAVVSVVLDGHEVEAQPDLL